MRHGQNQWWLKLIQMFTVVCRPEYRNPGFPARSSELSVVHISVWLQNPYYPFHVFCWKVKRNMFSPYILKWCNIAKYITQSTHCMYISVDLVLEKPKYRAIALCMTVSHTLPIHCLYRVYIQWNRMAGPMITWGLLPSTWLTASVFTTFDCFLYSFSGEYLANVWN